ncbi:hypothetical protein C5167_004837 [Papaver somniferum]|uniref:C2 NT-type domain-containing protein n=1 Tax=Papaver somniferum TaxID=3469 RepID=A0A4Y7J9N1_PAPSO|nr:myosin-11-like [Papaver somniferum]RZC57527.1 hypothetical protein C5167_004837 [Papaver somniferum]
MFKSARWKSDKNKTKIVFRLQFQATQVPQAGWDTLMVSLIPVDVGKPTVRSEKCSVRDGTCRWDNPIYEAVKFTQESKTGKFTEKIYKVIVSSGSSKSAILGEVTVDFSEYAEAVKATSVSLPLKVSNSGPLLHVVIYRMHGDAEKREVEENGEFMAKSQDGSIKTTAAVENVEPNGNLVVSRGFEATSTSGSESSSERNTPRELGLKTLMNNNTHQDPTSFLSSLSRNTMPHKRSSTDWSVGSVPEESTDDSTISSEENLAKERLTQVSSELSVEKLKTDFAVLARQAEVYELELQTLRKQVVKESKKGQDLSREVVTVKEERDSLKKECEQLRCSQKNVNGTKVASKFENDQGSTALLSELRQELNHEKDLNANLRLQLQKTQESNAELMLAVQDLDEMLEKKDKEDSLVSKKSATNEKQDTVPSTETSEDEDQQAMEVILKERGHGKDAYMLERKIVELYSEIDVYRRDRDELEMQMEQLALDYEILKQENHDLSFKVDSNQLQDHLKTQYELETQVENLEKEVKNQEREFLASLDTINELECQVKILEEQLRKQGEESSATTETINELESQVKTLEEQLRNQEEEFSASTETRNELEDQVMHLEALLSSQEEELAASSRTVHELEAQVKRLEKQLSSQEEEFSASSGTINEHDAQVKRLEKQLKNQEEEYALSLATVNELDTKVRNLENELKNREEEFSASLGTKSELETQVDSLKREVRNYEKEFLVSLDTTNELETQVKTLEEELEKQAQGFIADLDELTREKVEQEKRAIQAEDALRKTRRANANTAERLQEEFKRLSVQMASTFHANEKLALKAVEEANEIRLEKIRLEELLEKSNEDVGLVKDQYNEKLKDLSHQITFKHVQVDKLLLELEDKSKKLENQQDQEEEIRQNFLKEIQTLKKEIERLEAEKNEVTELEEQKHKLVQTGNVEKEEMERRIASVRKEAEISLEELNTVRSLKNENETKIGILQSEVETLRTQLNELKHSLLESETEKENLKQQVSDLRRDLLQKEDMLLDEIKLLKMQMLEKETALRESTNAFLAKEKSLRNNIEELEEELSQTYTEVKDGDNMTTLNGSAIEPVKRQNEDTEQTVCSSPNGCQANLDKMSSEMEFLKTRNISMESELKDMQERYSEISLKFAEVEGERQRLVMRVRNLNAKSSRV